MNREEIKIGCNMKDTCQYWNNRARNVKNHKLLTHFDLTQRQIEIDSIISFIKPDDVVLDIGCGNGFSTAIFSKKCKKIIGIDFSEAMISRAKKENSRKNISYQQADVRTMNLDVKFTKIITQRCLINILIWKEQQWAIRNILSHIKPKGYFLMLEGIADGRSNINDLRIGVGLKKLSVVEYNLDFQLKRTNTYLRKYFSIEGFKTYGIYEFVTRIIYPLYIYPQEPKYGSSFHEIAGKIVNSTNDLVPSLSKFGMWILKKKGKE